MFCGKCGYDCGEDPFCAKCGQRVIGEVAEEITGEAAGEAAEISRADRVRALYLSGQRYCPNCLSTSCKTEEDYQSGIPSRSVIVKAVLLLLKIRRRRRARKHGHSYRCLQCGFRWIPRLEDMKQMHRECVAGLLQEGSPRIYYGIDGKTLSLSEDKMFVSRPNKKALWFYMREVWGVSYHPGEKSEMGWLTIVLKYLKMFKLPMTLEHAKRDPFTVVFASEDRAQYEALADALKKVAQGNQDAGMD